MPPTTGHLRSLIIPGIIRYPPPSTAAANSWCLLSVQPTAARRPNLPAKHAPTCWHLQRRALTPPWHRQQQALTANSWRLLAVQPTTDHACPDLPGPPKHACQACHHPILLYRGFFPGRKQLGSDKVNFELLKQSVMHDFGVVLLFGSLFYILPRCCWFELPPTAGQQCCFWSG